MAHDKIQKMRFDITYTLNPGVFQNGSPVGHTYETDVAEIIIRKKPMRIMSIIAWAAAVRIRGLRPQ